MEFGAQKDRPVILIVEDDVTMRDTLEVILKNEYQVIKVPDGETALEMIKNVEINLVLLDIMLPGMDGIEVLKIIKDQYENIEVIIITVVKEIDTAVKAIKLGAYDYVTKDFDYDAVRNLVCRALEKQANKRKLLYFSSEMKQHFRSDLVLGNSENMKEIYAIIKKVAKLRTTVLIIGESGTGKELIARMIYNLGGDQTTPFVVVNLASIPKELAESILFGHEKGAFTGAHKQHIGKFELAHKGILVLDEISELHFDLQAKLLRALQEGEIGRVGSRKSIYVDVRIIAITNKNLKEEAAKGRFREDLYFRLNVIPIQLPPLRRRVGDIPRLVDFFLKKYNQRFGKKIEGLTDQALNLLTSYPWPGNIRELENLIERVVAINEGDSISAEDIPMEYHVPFLISMCHGDAVSEDLLKNACMTFERNFIIKTLEKMKGSRKKTAELLGIPLSTLKYKMRQLGVYDIIKSKSNIFD